MPDDDAIARLVKSFFFFAFACERKKMPDMTTISIDTETYKRLLKHLPSDVKLRIDGRATTPSGNATTINCDAKDQENIIAIARRHFPDKAWEIEREVRIARAEPQEKPN